MSDCKCKQPCGPCNNNCPDDGEIIESIILDPEDCNTNCCWKKCSDNCWINIQSTNDCLVVDTSECWVIKLTAECPKPTYVKAWKNITIKDVTPPDDCYIDWWDCGVKGWWEVSSTDETVKACGWDTTPGYLNEKLDAGNWIVIDEINCWWGNAYLRIWIKDWVIPECPEPPDLVINNQSQFINVTQSWDHRHIVTITDKSSQSIFDNTVMIWFLSNKDYTVWFNSDWNAERVSWIETSDQWWWWDLLTWNRKLATKNWIKIKQSWYYWLYWQLTVANNWKDYMRYTNLWRALLRIKWEREWIWWLFSSLCTSKHWAYWTWIVPKWGNWIQITQDWTISVTWASVTTSEEGWTYNISFNAWWGMQPQWGFDWPWMTHNIWVFVDLREWDEITLWYRCQSDIPEASGWHTTSFRIVWANDSSTEFKSLFWGTCLWVQLITPTLFQADVSNEIVESIK